MSRKRHSSIVYKLFNRVGIFVTNHKYLFFFLNFTWGAVTTIFGYALLLLLSPFGNIRRFGYTFYLEFNKRTGYGFSIGAVFFLTKDGGYVMKTHEFGHCIQNAILGPLFPILVAIPSFTRFWYRENLYKKGLEPSTEYDDIWFEESASIIGASIIDIYTTNIK